MLLEKFHVNSYVEGKIFEKFYLVKFLKNFTLDV
jgi:hypothetical protein